MKECVDVAKSPYSIHGIVEDCYEGTILFVVEWVSLIVFASSVKSHYQCWN